MDVKKLKKGQEYYCLIGERWHLSLSIVRVKYIGSYDYPYNNDLISVEQNIDGFIHSFGIDAKAMYPLDKRIISAVLHNDRQSRRIIEHPKSYDHTNAKERVLGWIATLLETDQKALMVRFREHNPKLVSPKGEYLTSKFKMKDWHSLMSGYFHYKYPIVNVPEF